MFLENYKPKSVAGMIGNRLQAGDLKRTLSGWKRGSALVLSGPPGCGKTLSVELAAREIGADIVTGTYDDLVAASGQANVWGRGKILVANLDDEISPSDALKLAEHSTWPVVFETTDIYQRNLVELRKDTRVKIIQFQKAGAVELVGLLKKICISERIACDERALYELIRLSDYDVRFALIALESLRAVDSESLKEIDKDRVERIFDMLDAVFQRRSANADVESLYAWIIENIPERYSGKELDQAYHCASAASRFRRLGLDRYSEQLVQLLPQSRISAQYRPPRWIGNGTKKQ
jgi:replication factor C large subunit